MPIYEYDCLEHGLFEEMRPMHRSKEAADCPRCAAASARVLSATRTNVLPRAVGLAHARNEKSQHAPEVCTRGHHHHPLPKKGGRAGQPQVYRGKRPWVMEHG